MHGGKVVCSKVTVGAWGSVGFGMQMTMEGGFAAVCGGLHTADALQTAGTYVKMKTILHITVIMIAILV